MNSKSFYDSIRATLFGGRITSSQLVGMEAIIEEYNARAIQDVRKLAYILATAYHETAKTMRPIEEYGKGKGKPYGSKITASGKSYLLPNKIYYGRGFVQLTWYENYSSMGRLLGIDLLRNPELALQMGVSVRIMFEGMLRGSFTGKRLGQYFNDTKTDPLVARRIINGTDAAAKIKRIYDLFYGALTLQ